ncbi:HAMP domain-containing histidine kinase [bacterium]|nr:HAMP domain-containing histidine kinase [bacterium]
MNENNINNQIKFISHEIRNHLSICDMYSQIIRKNIEKDGIKNDSIINALDCIQKSIQIISSNIMDLKSIDTNAKKIYDFKTLVLKGVEMAKVYPEDKEIDFEVFIKNTNNIFVDENRFISCIVNIIKNGIEAIEFRGKITVLGEVRNGDVILKISNDGKQIPKEKQKSIFEKGFTTKSTGCGLGLCICKQYIESQGAELSLVKSTKSETQFEIKLPICDY